MINSTLIFTRWLTATVCRNQENVYLQLKLCERIYESFVILAVDYHEIALIKAIWSGHRSKTQTCDLQLWP